MKLFQLIILCFALIFQIKAEYWTFYECFQSETVCAFKDLLIDYSNYEWIPVCGNAAIVEHVAFNESIVPVLNRRFCEGFPNLQILSMSEVKLEGLDMFGLERCKNLKILNLSRNNIKIIHPFLLQYNMDLEEIRLEHNKIKWTGNKLFENFKNLRKLVLHDNKFKSFSPELIKGSVNLSYIDISNNKITDLDVDVIIDYLPNLTHFILHGNDIEPRRMEEILTILHEHGIATEV